MSRRYSLALVLLVVVALSGCALRNQQVPRTQSPVFVAPNAPSPDPASLSAVTTNGEWCRLRAFGDNWFLCNLHYHRPSEHGRPVAGGVLPPCAGAEGTTPNEWAEIHYAYSVPPIAGSCDVLRARALETPLGDCASPYIVRTVWARITPNGTFDPTKDVVSDSARYMEYAGSSTGDTGGKEPVYWKINRDCVEVTAEALLPLHKDRVRGLQPPTTVMSTRDR
jgi:hypothetical protein